MNARSAARDRTIVVGVDGSAAAYDATAWAAAEAARHDCRLLIVTSATSGFRLLSGDPDAPEPDAAVLAEAAAVAHIASAGIRISTEAVTEPIIPYLHARSATARMVVVGSRGAGRRQGRLGSVSLAVTRSAHCPVSVVPAFPRIDPAGPVLLGLDNWHTGPGAIELAFQEAALRQAELIVIQARKASRAADAKDRVNVAPVTRLPAVAARYPQVVAHRMAVRGKALPALLEAARAAQLVVLGHGHGGMAGAVLESTSAGVLEAADCPVIVVRDGVAVAPSSKEGGARPDSRVR